jgi:hypothetical protein
MPSRESLHLQRPREPHRHHRLILGRLVPGPINMVRYTDELRGWQSVLYVDGITAPTEMVSDPNIPRQVA